MEQTSESELIAQDEQPTNERELAYALQTLDMAQQGSTDAYKRLREAQLDVAAADQAESDAVDAVQRIVSRLDWRAILNREEAPNL